MPTTEKRVTRDGGQAFPGVDYYDEKPVGTTSGMSLRDYFAAHALPAVYARAVAMGNDQQEFIVAEAYEIADSMLEERAK